MVPARLSGQRSPCQPHVTAWIPALGERSAPLTARSIYCINERREDFPSIPLCNISATLQAGYYYLKWFEDNHQLTEPCSSTSFCPTPEPLVSSDTQRAPFNRATWGEATCVRPHPTQDRTPELCAHLFLTPNHSSRKCRQQPPASPWQPRSFCS